MKHSKIFGIALSAFALLASACSDDLGNYTYGPVNEVDVAFGDELVRGETYPYTSHYDHMRFSPKLESTLGITDDGAYDFEWRIIPNGAQTEEVDYEESIVCRTREIDYLVTLRPGKYNCYFSARDKATGVKWTVPFKIEVTSATNEGWLVLCEENGRTRLDLIFNKTKDEDILFRDMLAEFDYEVGKPRHIFFNFSRRYMNTTLLVTDKDTYRLDPDDLHAGNDNRLAWDFGITPDHINITASAISDLAKSLVWAVIDDKDEIYTMTLITGDGTIEDGAVFLNPITLIDGVTPFKPAPFIGTHPRYISGGTRVSANPFVFYDQTHSQFLVLTNTSVYPEVMKFEGNQLFENPTGGKQMVWMENVRQIDNVASVLKDPATGEMFYYAIGFHSRNSTESGKENTIYYQSQEGYCKITGPDVDKAEHFAFHSMWYYLFYSVGSKIYKFDLTNPSLPAIEVANLVGEEISVLKFNPFYKSYSRKEAWKADREFDLVVGSNVQGKDESECGKVRFYNIPNLYTGPITLKKEFDGFGKILEITHKEPKN